MKDEFKAIFMGRDTVAIGTIKVEGDKVFFKHSNKLFLIKYKLLIQHYGDLLSTYQERKLFDMENGRTDTMVRIYPFDIDTLERYYPNMNMSGVRQLESLQDENVFLKDKTVDLQSFNQNLAGDDLMKSHFYKEFKFYDEKIKPGSMFNANKEGAKK